MSIRIVSPQQFSDGTSIDGNRLEEAMQQLEEMCDQVPKGRVQRRFLQSQVTVGFAPFQQAPFNTSFPVTSGGTSLQTLTQNLERYKGYKSTIDTADIEAVLFWETSFQADNPLIIHALDCFMQMDVLGSAGITPNYVLPGGTTPAPGIYFPPQVYDVQLFVTVDAPFIPEDRSQTDVLIHKYGMDMNAWQLNLDLATLAPTNDMLPAFPGANVSGWAITLDALNLPLPQGARVRFALGIPKYKAATAGFTNWGATPWKTFSPSMTVTLLEPLGSV